MSTNDDLPPLPVGQKMGYATINGQYIEIRMHDDNAMQAYAREAVAADRSKRATPLPKEQT